MHPQPHDQHRSGNLNIVQDNDHTDLKVGCGGVGWWRGGGVVRGHFGGLNKPVDNKQTGWSQKWDVDVWGPLGGSREVAGSSGSLEKRSTTSATSVGSVRTHFTHFTHSTHAGQCAHCINSGFPCFCLYPRPSLFLSASASFLVSVCLRVRPCFCLPPRPSLFLSASASFLVSEHDTPRTHAVHPRADAGDHRLRRLRRRVQGLLARTPRRCQGAIWDGCCARMVCREATCGA
eukprot:364119-Chlamydomonas_euryale.AAC.3